VRRPFPTRALDHVDPFLLLDEMGPVELGPGQAKGAPDHPHRGFETVTYMLDGHMRHEDSGGNRGDLGPGDVQWMTAARGIIHSEMPQQTEGRMRGFQLWINLPAKEKMKPAAYSDIPSGAIPVLTLKENVLVKIIAGKIGETEGPIRGLSTEPIYFDLHFPAGANAEIPLPADHNAFLYAYDGEATVGTEATPLPHRAAGLLSDGGAVRIAAGARGARVLLLAGKPIREPIVQYGPFVMNTREEIERAIADYQSGKLTSV